MKGAAAPAPDDMDLVRRCLAGERECFTTLVERHQRSLYRAALAVVRNPADAEEVLQETFLRAFEHLPQFRGEAKFQTWLTQIALNTARMRLRKEHVALWESLDEPRQREDGNVAWEPADGRETPEQWYGRMERARLVEQALAGLAPGYRAVLALRDILMLSTGETAQALGLSEANVKTRLMRARLQLRARLEGPMQGGARERGVAKAKPCPQ